MLIIHVKTAIFTSTVETFYHSKSLNFSLQWEIFLMHALMCIKSDVQTLMHRVVEIVRNRLMLSARTETPFPVGVDLLFNSSQRTRLAFYF